MQVTSSRGVEPARYDSPLMMGEVQSKMLLDVPDAQQLRFNYVRFLPGGRTRWHTHSFEQALVIVEGKGIVANEAGEHVVQAGDIAVIAPREKHWHGATETTAMAHVAINQAGDLEILEPVEEIQTPDA